MALKQVGKGLDAILHSIDRGKKFLEPSIDKLLFLTAANIGIVYGAAELIDSSMYSSGTNGLIMMGAGAALTAGNFLALRSTETVGLRKRAAKLNSLVDKLRPLSWVKSGLLVASVAYAGSGLNPYFQQVKEDFFPSTAPLSLSEGAPTPTSATVPIERNPRYDDSLGYNNLVSEDFSGTRLADKNSTIGRIQRTLRWQPIYRAVEKVHGLPQDTLAGMIMQESYGNPVQPNASDDGGLGVVHIQGTTGRLYGLKIHGSSNADSDYNHGRQIRQMLIDCNYDPSCAQKYDDRAHIIKVLDAAARIVGEGKAKHGTWDKGVEYYRAPGKVGRNLTWRYLNDVKKWQRGIRNPEELSKASEDFQKRNGMPFNNYIKRWHSTANNWGLANYIKKTRN